MTATDRLGRWREQAACLGLADLFLPKGGDTSKTGQARTVCGTCPVKAVCLATAMDEEGSVDQWRRAGVRGGLTPAERERRYVNGQRRAREKAR